MKAREANGEAMPSCRRPNVDMGVCVRELSGRFKGEGRKRFSLDQGPTT